MQTTDQIALCSLVVAIFALLIAAKGYSVAKKSLLITEADHVEKFKDIVGYLIKCFNWRLNGDSYATFAVSYTNNASSPNSLKDIFLEIEYYDEHRVFNKAKIPPEAGVLSTSLSTGYEELKAPLNLLPKETKSGWITFKIPRIENLQLNIDIHRIIATSTDDKKTAVESYIMTLVD
ncbi:hypothetical protein ACX3YG_13795 [Pseudomonas wadenswilerensis]